MLLDEHPPHKRLTLTRDGNIKKSNKYFSVEISHELGGSNHRAYFFHVFHFLTVSQRVTQYHMHSISIDWSNSVWNTSKGKPRS